MYIHTYIYIPSLLCDHHILPRHPVARYPSPVPMISRCWSSGRIWSVREEAGAPVVVAGVHILRHLGGRLHYLTNKNEWGSEWDLLLIQHSYGIQ